MFESIFGGDLNGQCVYDVDWEDYPEGGAKTSGGSVGATVIGKFTRETGKAILYDFWGWDINLKTGENNLGKILMEIRESLFDDLKLGAALKSL